MRVLFVCRRNAGRSQIAAGITRGRYPHIDVRSGGVDPDLGGPSVPDDVQQVIGEHGGVICPLTRRRLITPDDIAWADRIVMIVEPDRWPAWVDRNKVEFWDIADPRRQPYEVLQACADDIDRRLTDLADPSH